MLTFNKVWVCTLGSGLAWNEWALITGSNSERLREGAVIRSTALSDDYSYADWQANGLEDDIALAAWSASGQLILFAEDEKKTPGDGWTIAWLTSTEEQNERE